jgi:exocyst complex component 2
VTGLSPKEGPPGTKVTIRGENLGVSPDDLIELTICGQDCLIYADWQSPSKIITRSMRFKGLGDVIVVTRSGGVGTCTVQFRGYEEVVSLTKDSAVWVNEDDIPSVTTTSRHRAASSPMILMPDPLGLEYESDFDVDEESNESTDTAFGADMITSENFDPALFLMHKHHKAGFLQLKAGLQNLRREVDSREHGGSTINPITLLKPNVLSVVECLDALSKITAYLKADRSQYGQDLTHKIEEHIRKASDDADSIFKDVLEKKDHADSTRNALNVLQRYRFLFNLPSTIERNIQKGDYDLVINDYARAKALFEKSEIKVFKRVYDEVEQRIANLKQVLQDKLKQSCSRPDQRNVEEIKKLMRYLVNLGIEGNPAWQAILCIKSVLLEKMIECRDRHLSMAQTSKPEDCVHDPPRTVLFSEELLSIFNQYYPDLMRLGHDYLSGNLFTRETEESLKAKEAIFESEMTQESIRTLVTLIRSALLPQQQVRTDNKLSWPTETTSHDMIVWLPHCLRTIINCYQSLLRHEMIMSSNALQQVQQLIFDFRVHSLTYLFNQVSDEIRALYMKENWDVNLDNVTGTRTQLPLLFESAVINQLQLVRETILQTSSADEVDIFTQINVQGQMKQLAQNMMQAFLTALEKTLTDSIPSVPKSVYSPDERILLVMCNCLFVTTHVFPRLQEIFDKYSYPDMSLVLKVSITKFKEYETKLEKQFTERKRDQVIGSIEPSMYCLNREWYCPSHKPTDVSYYVKELLENLIAVQAQVFSIAPALVRRVLVEVIDASVEEVSRLHECMADRFNENGNLQAILDFKALRTAFRDMESESTEKLLDNSFDHLRPVHNAEDRDALEKLLNQMKQSMHLQLYCFRWETDQTVIVI